MTPEERLTRHVDRFNASVRTGDFGAYTELFAAEGQLKVVADDQHPATGVYRGRDEIKTVLAGSLAGDTLKIVSVIAAKNESATFDYARGKRPKAVAGQIILKWQDERVSSMTITMQ